MLNERVKITAVIAAAGKGKRFVGSIKKQFYPIKGKQLIAWTLDVFDRNARVDEIVVILEKGDEEYFSKEILGRYQFSKNIRLVEGGQERQDSVYNGIMSVSEDTDIILIHDGARAFISSEIIGMVIDGAIEEGAAIAAVKQNDTTVFENGGFIKDFIDREFIYRVQTPQGFRKDLIIKAFQKAYKDGFYGTDESSLVVRMGEKVKIVEGSYNNIKVTSQDDLYMAERILENIAKQRERIMRIGAGYDAHRLKEGCKLILGGVDIEFEKGLEGYSDADVLAHAIVDALLGAANLGDIGKWFPDSDEKYKDISSMVLLKKVSSILSEQKYQVENIDSVLVLEKPKIVSFTDRMKDNISKALGIEKDKVSVKATTTEGMGFEGKGEGICAYAVALLKKK